MRLGSCNDRYEMRRFAGEVLSKQSLLNQLLDFESKVYLIAASAGYTTKWELLWETGDLERSYRSNDAHDRHSGCLGRDKSSGLGRRRWNSIRLRHCSWMETFRAQALMITEFSTCHSNSRSMQWRRASLCGSCKRLRQWAPMEASSFSDGISFDSLHISTWHAAKPSNVYLEIYYMLINQHH